MSSTPPDEYTPAPVRYPGAGGRVGHRLSPSVVLAVIVVVMLIAFGLIGAVVLPTKPREPRTPPLQLPGKPAAMAALVQSQTISPTVAQVRLAGTDAVALPHGVSVTPAAGWAVKKQVDNGVLLCNTDCSALLSIGVGTTKETDVVAIVQAEINAARSSDSGFSNLQFAEINKDKTDSSKFPQYAFIAFVADVVIQNGTLPVTGALSALLNPSTGVFAGLTFEGVGQQAFEQAVPEYKSMVKSML